MPCSDSREHDDNKELKARLDNVTALLCALMLRIDSIDNIRGRVDASCTLESVVEYLLSDPDLEAWWNEHELADELRKQREDNQQLIDAVIKARRKP